MKKLLLLGFVLAIVLLAFPQGVMADTDSATVNANIVTSLEFDVTGPAGQLSLNAGPATTTFPSAIQFDVTSNSPWTVKVLSAAPADGKMVPNSGASPALDKELQIEGLTAYQYVVTDKANILDESETDFDGTTYYKGLQQETVFDDTRLTGGNYYTISLTFECLQDV